MGACLPVGRVFCYNNAMKKSAGFFLVFLVGFLMGWAVFFITSDNNDQNISEIREGGYIYINPLLDCDQSDAINEKNLRSFKKKVENLVNQQLEDELINHISVYYRDLNNGPWFGINEENNYAPQSLLKLPIMIAYLKLSQTNPELLDKTIVYDQFLYQAKDNSAEVDYYQADQSYQVNQLIERMIIYSDNTAFNILVKNINQQDIQKVHQDLGLAYPTTETPDDFISVKSYASLFRVLYNSSYLNREKSELALDILSRSEYDRGITAGLPTDMVVANKFGIREENEEIKQLHDCGIVYSANNPYMICLMSRGNFITKLEDSIKEISKLIYQEVVK